MTTKRQPISDITSKPAVEQETVFVFINTKDDDKLDSQRETSKQPDCVQVPEVKNGTKSLPTAFVSAQFRGPSPDPSESMDLEGEVNIDVSGKF